MRQDEVQGNEPRANVFEGVVAAVAKVFPTDGSVDDAGEKVVHETVAEKGAGCGMALAKEFLGEGHALVPALDSRELQKLAHGEVPGMCGYEVEKACLIFGVAEAAKVGATGFRKVHRLKITVFNSR
jgi:hypothetical protein